MLRTLALTVLSTVVFSSSALALNPSRTYKQTPDKFNMVYKPAEATTDDGATVKIWDFSCKKASGCGVLVIAHSGEGNMADYLRRIEVLTANNAVVAFDYRGFGESSEFEIDNNMYIYPHFQQDLEAVITYTRQQHRQVFDLYGFGVGGGLALGIGWNRTEIRRIIADTPFLSMEDLESRFSSWDEPMEVPFAGYDKRYEPIYSFDSDPISMKGQTKKVKLIVGSNDRLFKSSDYTALFAKQKASVDKTVLVVENPDRKDNFRIDKAGYSAAMLAFLSE